MPFLISDDRARIDVDAVYAFLSNAYWSIGMTRDVLERAIANSLCFGVYDGDRQVGFARAITDRATYAYLSDVYILDEYRGRGLGKQLVATILAHPDLQRLRRISLFSRDARGLYEQFGFHEARGGSVYLETRGQGPGARGHGDARP